MFHRYEIPQEDGYQRGRVAVNEIQFNKSLVEAKLKGASAFSAAR